MKRKDKFHKNLEFGKQYRILSNQKIANEKRIDIMSACKVSKDVFYNWLKLRTEIPDCHLRTISEIMKQPIDKLFPPKIYSQIL